MGRVFATSDWHGCAHPAEKLISYLKDDDKLYFLGDSIDRGDDGIELFNFLIKDPRVTYLCGNHEEIMYKAILASLDHIHSNTLSIWLYGNGGKKTWSDIELLDKEELLKYVEKIKAMPLSAEYHSPKGHTVILEHAGFTPDSVSLSHDPLWDRDHFMYPWMDEKANVSPDRAKEINNTYLVHGHTPVQYLKYHYRYFNTTENPSKPQLTLEDMAEKKAFFNGEKTDIKPKVLQYCDGHKFDIDMCTIVSDRIALLDLDTFETIYID
jgi:serine/threonine protein phosphatase 1